MVRDGLRYLCNRRLEIGHDQDSITPAILDERRAEFHHGILPEMAVEIGLAVALVTRDN